MNSCENDQPGSRINCLYSSRFPGFIYLFAGTEISQIPKTGVFTHSPLFGQSSVSSVSSTCRRKQCFSKPDYHHSTDETNCRLLQKFLNCSSGRLRFRPSDACGLQSPVRRRICVWYLYHPTAEYLEPATEAWADGPTEYCEKAISDVTCSRFASKYLRRALVDIVTISLFATINRNAWRSLCRMARLAEHLWRRSLGS